MLKITNTANKDGGAIWFELDSVKIGIGLNVDELSEMQKLLKQIQVHYDNENNLEGVFLEWKGSVYMLNSIEEYNKIYKLINLIIKDVENEHNSNDK